jgi:hypothetical protein
LLGKKENPTLFSSFNFLLHTSHHCGVSRMS